MNDERARRSNAERQFIAGIGAVAVVALAANALGVLFVSWHLQTYFRLAGIWFVVGAIMLVCQFSTNLFRWPVAIAAVALAALGVLINIYIAGQISASCRDDPA